MPRPARLLLSQSYYHVMTRGNNRHVVFRCDEDYKYYLELIRRYKQEHPFDLYHYCLMPNHVHLLVKTNIATDFSTFMKRLNLSYFHHYRQNYGWVGHFWQDRFKSKPVGKDAYFIQCGKYIELNPTRKKLVEKPEDYVYSSYGYYVSGKRDKMITTDPLYRELDKNEEIRREKYIKLVVEGVVLENYSRPIWGSDYQQYHENRKQNYHLNKK